MAAVDETDEALYKGLPSSYRAYADFAAEKFERGDIGSASLLYQQLVAKLDKYHVNPTAIALFHNRLAACNALLGNAAGAIPVFESCTKHLKATQTEDSAFVGAMFSCYSNWCDALLDDTKARSYGPCEEAFKFSERDDDLKLKGRMLRGRKDFAEGSLDDAIEGFDAVLKDAHDDHSLVESARTWLLRALVSKTSQSKDSCNRVTDVVNALEGGEQNPGILALIAFARAQCEEGESTETKDATNKALAAIAGHSHGLGCKSFSAEPSEKVSKKLTALSFYEFSDVAVVHPTGILSKLPKHEDEVSEKCPVYITVSKHLGRLSPRTSLGGITNELFPSKEIVAINGNRRQQIEVDVPVLFVPMHDPSFAELILDVLPKVFYVKSWFPDQKIVMLADPMHKVLVDMLRPLGFSQEEDTIVPYYRPDILLCQRVHVAGDWSSVDEQRKAIKDLSSFYRSREEKRHDSDHWNVVYLSRKGIPGDNSVSDVDDHAIVEMLTTVVGKEHFTVVRPHEMDTKEFVDSFNDCVAIIGAPGSMLASAVLARDGRTLLVLPTESTESQDGVAASLTKLTNTKVEYVEKNSEESRCPECVVSIHSLRSLLLKVVPSSAQRAEQSSSSQNEPKEEL